MVKLPEGWERRRLGDVSSVIMGQSPSSSLINKEGKGLPFLQGNAEFTSKYPNPINWIEKPLKTASKGSILVSVRAPIGDLNFANSQCCIGRGLASIEANGFIVDNIFLWYSMHYFINELIRIGQGSTFEAIGRNELRNLCISLPPLPEQRKIAEILETADKAIEKTDAIIEKYRRIKQGLMQDLLTKGIDEKGQIRSEETHKFKDSPLGRLPEEWEVANIGKAGKVITGSTPPTANPKYYGDCYLFISPEDITNSKFITDTQKKLSECGFKISRSVLPYSICVVCIGSTIGKVAMTKSICTTNQQINSIIPDINIFNPDALFYFVLFYSQTPLKHEAGLQAVPIVNKSRFSTIKIPLPPLPEQHRIASVLSQIDEVIEKEERYKEKLGRIKQGLMQDLLTGKVRVNHLIKET